MRSSFKTILALAGTIIALTGNSYAVDLLYAADNTGQIFTFDLSSGVPGQIQSSKSLFSSTGLSNPTLAVDPQGNLYAANETGILKVNPSGAVSPFAAVVTSSMAFDRNGNLFSVYGYDGTIHKITSTGGVSAYANMPTAMSIQLAIDSVGNIFASMYSQNIVLKIPTSGSQSTFASSNWLNSSGLAIDSSDNLYWTRQYWGNAGIQKITPDGTLSTFSDFGGGGLGASSPMFDSSGNLYIGGPIGGFSKINSTGSVVFTFDPGIQNMRGTAIGVSVPEPSTYALAIVASGVMAVAVRRRNRRNV